MSFAAYLTRSKAALIAENALLCQQLIVLHRRVKKPVFSPSDRLWLVLLAGRVKSWKDAVLILSPTLSCADIAKAFVCLGAGLYEPDLRKIDQQARVADRVEICSIPGSDRQGTTCLLAQAAVVLLSGYGAQSIAVMEALSLQQPVLVTDVAALSEFADRGWARSVSLSAPPEEIARSILVQLRQPIVPCDVTLPTWDDCAAALLSLYQQVVEGTRRIIALKKKSN